MVDRRARRAELADQAAVDPAEHAIDTTPNARAKVGLTPGTERSLVGWGLRVRGGRGWYVDGIDRDHDPLVLQVFDARGAVVPRPPADRADVAAMAFHCDRREPPHPIRVPMRRLSRLVAIPDHDGRFLAAQLARASATPREHDHPTFRRRPEVAAAGAAPRSDPLFLVGAFVCRPAPDPGRAPVHEGSFGPARLEATRVAQEGYDLVAATALGLVGQGYPWGGTAAQVGARVADVLVARYPGAIAKVATAALARAVDATGSMVMPDPGWDDEGEARLAARLWAAWAFGPRATVGRGREIVRAARARASVEEVDRTLTRVLCALHLATLRAAAPTLAALPVG